MNNENKLEILEKIKNYGFNGYEMFTWRVDSNGLHDDFRVYDQPNSMEINDGMRRVGSLRKLIGEFEDLCYEYVKDRDWSSHGQGCPNNAYRTVYGILNLLCEAERNAADPTMRENMQDIVKKRELVRQIVDVVFDVKNEIVHPVVGKRRLQEIAMENRYQCHLSDSDVTNIKNIASILPCGLTSSSDVKGYVLSELNWNLDE